MITNADAIATAEALRASVEVTRDGSTTRVAAIGDWLTRTIAAVDPSLRELETDRSAGDVVVALSQIGRIATGGACRTKQV